MIGEIYILKSLDLYKVGKTKDFKKRFYHYKTYNPHGVEIIFSGRVKNYHAMERIIHNKFKEKRVSGEWFRFQIKDLDDLMKIILPKMTSVLEKLTWQTHK